MGFGAGIASLFSVQGNLAKTIARDKPVSTLNVLANIMNTGIINNDVLKIFYAHDVSHKR